MISIQKSRIVIFIADEEESYVRQIDELKQNVAKKDAELSQLQADLAKMKKVRNRLDNLNCSELCFRLSDFRPNLREKNVTVCQRHIDLSTPKETQQSV